jgi:hypothetical protein
MTSKAPAIPGFRNSPKKNAKGAIYQGLFTCPDVQWTGAGSDAMATFTITADEIADAAQAQLLWTDQDVQRGIQPGVSPQPPKELTLAAGYPDPTKYVFRADNADEIAEKLLRGEKLFLNPLVWNLRPHTFEAYWDANQRSIYIYSGKIYLPDSHHRQQAIIKAVRVWRSAPRDYPKFSGDHQFKIELYFLSREDEGNYFYDKNQLPTPTAKSKAYDLTTVDDLSLLAKRVIDRSKALQGNVNRVTDRLTAKNPQVVTLSTLREMMKTFAPSDSFEASELDGMADVAAAFYDMLASVRPELAELSRQDRRKVRDALVVDAAVMMHGYAALMREYSRDLVKQGTKKATADWKSRLSALKADRSYKLDNWSGDVFDKNNPLWLAVGVTKRSLDGNRLTVLNTGAARAQCGRVLRQLLSVTPTPKDLKFLTK